MPEVTMRERQSEPTRTCVGCGKRDRQAGLLRLQVSPADGILRLVRRAGAGRSAYLHPTGTCSAGLAKSRLIAKSLRRAVTEDERVRVLQEVQAVLRRAQMNGGETAQRKA